MAMRGKKKEAERKKRQSEKMAMKQRKVEVTCKPKFQPKYMQKTTLDGNQAK